MGYNRRVFGGETMERKSWCMLVAGLAWLLTFEPGHAQQPSLTWLGTLGGSRSVAHGVSADGSVVVGVSFSSSALRETAFRWTASTGIQPLETPFSYSSGAYAVSADGTVIVGWVQQPGYGYRAVRWSERHGLALEYLGTLGGQESAAWSVSSNGAVIVGEAHNSSNRTRAFRWENGVMQDLGHLPGGDWSVAHDVSADGYVIVGASIGMDTQRHAVRWVNGILEDIGMLPGTFASVAWAVSADGSVIVGESLGTNQGYAFRWVNGVMQPLGSWTSAVGLSPKDVSADGNVVVGQSRSGAFRWTPIGGKEVLSEVYAHLLTPGSWLRVAHAVSPNGRYIVGQGYNAVSGREEAFLLDTGAAPLLFIMSCPPDPFCQFPLYISWAAIDDATPREALLFSWRLYLEGEAADWSDWQPQTSITYASLPEGDYVFEVRAIDLDGNISEPKRCRFRVRHDTQPPGITAIRVENIPTGVRVRWQTDEPATSLVEYRLKGMQEWRRSEDSTALVTDHAVSLTGLTAGVYEFRVRSRDACGYETFSPVDIFVTQWSATLIWLGVLPDYASSSTATGVSADGSVVVGYAFNSSYGRRRAFRWANGTMQDLGLLPYYDESEALGVSANGSVAVGVMTQRSTRHTIAFRWQNGVLDNLGLVSQSSANGVSADGSVIAGTNQFILGQNRAFRWVRGRVESLGTLPGGGASFAYGVSADGSVVVGYAYNASFSQRAFRWTDGVMQDLGILPGHAQSYASGVSADGTVVVGWSSPSSGSPVAFRWKDGRMQSLGTLPGTSFSWAYAASADGSIVVGTSGNLAFRWTQSGRMENLNTTYAELLHGGSRLLVAYAISPDGRYIVGSGYNVATRRTEAFLLDTWRAGDTNGDHCVDDADLLNVIFAFGTPGTGYTRPEDIDKNGTVDDNDLLTVLFNFGQGC